jgi:hypothetical protein
MDYQDPNTRHDYLQVLRDTLARIERNPDSYFNEAAHAEFKRILATRIALLERIELLAADAAEAPVNERSFRVQVHIRGVEIVNCKQTGTSRKAI